MRQIVDLSPFGGWSISREAFGWMLAHVPKGKTILEFGFGASTYEFVAAGYHMVSIETNTFAGIAGKGTRWIR